MVAPEIIYRTEVFVAERMYSTTDLAEIFGTTRQTVNTWIDDKRFPNVQKVGRSYGIPASDVVAFIKTRIEEYQKEIDALEKIQEEVGKSLAG